MGISFGSVSKKPYVGSKEVTEAYVGSQLVYKAQKLPYHYVYLGTENAYYISDLVTLGTGAAITKPTGATTYKLALSGLTGNSIKINLDPEFVGQRFKFLARGTTNGVSIDVKFYTSSGLGAESTFNLTTQETLKTTKLVTSAETYIEINATGQAYFDAMRFEADA
jgi:hypothetical protein